MIGRDFLVNNRLKSPAGYLSPEELSSQTVRRTLIGIRDLQGLEKASSGVKQSSGNLKGRRFLLTEK